MKAETLEKVAFQLIKTAATYLPDDVKQALKKACANETSEMAKAQLEAILRNIELAEQQKAPICQDTGMITFYVKAGAQVENLDEVESALAEAVHRATAEIPLRPNAVNPFTQSNSGDNTGRGLPIVRWEIVQGGVLELTAVLKGGGSENVTSLGMLNPGEGVKGLKRFVIAAVVNAGAQPCPPTILGVAVGGSADEALVMAKKVLLRPLNQVNPDQQVAKLERELLESVNMLDIGPMGLGGDTTVLGIHVDYAFRHPASFPVAVVFSCWCDRRATARITDKDEVIYLSNSKRGSAT